MKILNGSICFCLFTNSNNKVLHYIFSTLKISCYLLLEWNLCCGGCFQKGLELQSLVYCKMPYMKKLFSEMQREFLGAGPPPAPRLHRPYYISTWIFTKCCMRKHNFPLADSCVTGNFSAHCFCHSLAPMLSHLPLGLQMWGSSKADAGYYCWLRW